MYLQLHDGPTMAQQKTYPNVPDLRLPEMLKVSNRQIMIQAAEEAAVYAEKKLQSAIDKDSTNEELPTLDISALENYQYEIVPEDNGMGFTWKEVGVFLLKNWKAIKNFFDQFAKTVLLFRVNNRVETFYDANYYQVQNLNNLTPQQIDQQLALITGDLLNAGADKQKVDAMALSRFSQVYQQRKVMLPAVSPRTMLIAGGALLAYFLFKK